MFRPVRTYSVSIQHSESQEVDLKFAWSPLMSQTHDCRQKKSEEYGPGLPIEFKIAIHRPGSVVLQYF